MLNHRSSTTRQRLLVAMLLGALTSVSLNGCSGGDNDDPGSAQTFTASTPPADQPASQPLNFERSGEAWHATVASKFELSLEGDSPTAPRVAAAVSENLPTPAPESVAQLSEFVSFEANSDVTFPARVSFPVPANLAGAYPAVFWQGDNGSWQALPATWDKADGMVTAELAHFSGGFLGGISLDPIKNAVKDKWSQLFLGRAGADRPHCDGEARARAGGIKVTSEGGDSVMWCYGADGNDRVLKVVNNRATYAIMNFPSSWKVVRPGSFTFSQATLERATGLALGNTPGRQDWVVDSGDTLRIKVPDGASGRVNVSMSVGAWLVAGVLSAVEAVITAAKIAKVSGVQKANSLRQRVIGTLRGAGDDNATGALKDCLRGIGDLSEINAGELGLGKVLKFGLKCGTKVAVVYVRQGLGFIAAAAFTVAIAAVEAVTALTTFFTSGLRELVDGIASIGGKSDPDYDIEVRAPARIIDVSDAREAAFATPSGNISCDMRAANPEYGDPLTVRCDIAEATFATGPRPRSCPLDYGRSFELTDRAQRLCVGDTVTMQADLSYSGPFGATDWFDQARRDGDAVVAYLDNGVDTAVAAVDYGVSIKMGAITCSVAETGVVCVNVDTRHGFEVSRTSFDIE